MRYSKSDDIVKIKIQTNPIKLTCASIIKREK